MSLFRSTRARANNTRQLPFHQSKREDAVDRRWRSDHLRFERHPALSRREDEAVPAREYAQSAGRTLLVALLRLKWRWAVFRPGLPLQRRRAREDRICDQSIQFRNAPALEDPRRPVGRTEIYARRHLHDRGYVDLGLELGCSSPVGRGDLVEDGQCQATRRRDQRAPGRRSRQQIEGKACLQARVRRRGQAASVSASDAKGRLATCWLRQARSPCRSTRRSPPSPPWRGRPRSRLSAPAS